MVKVLFRDRKIAGQIRLEAESNGRSEFLTLTRFHRALHGATPYSEIRIAFSTRVTRS